MATKKAATKRSNGKAKDSARHEAMRLASVGKAPDHLVIDWRDDKPEDESNWRALVDTMPVTSIRWIKRDRLKANDYNPNHVAPPELELLELSILEDGWTQPLVVRIQDLEIVDGFHRWMVAARPKIYALTDGYVPVSFLDKPLKDRMMSTIRHNRARGVHGVRPMSEIVRKLVEMEVSEEEICQRLGMEREEYDRLFDNSGMIHRGATLEKFNPGWVPARASVAKPILVQAARNGKAKAAKKVAAKKAPVKKRGK